MKCQTGSRYGWGLEPQSFAQGLRLLAEQVESGSLTIMDVEARFARGTVSSIDIRLGRGHASLDPAWRALTKEIEG